ncbi:MAG TPA: ABC transporter permease subunit [Xanthobacteraceae bacterium]|nr:ABC transporter permease subunit [Xanthobacteraceae bacterium]
MAAIAIRIVAYAALAYLALPLVVLLGASVTATSYLSFPPRGVTLAWYGRMLDDPSYLSAFATSSLLAAAATLAAVLLAIPAALAIARDRFPGRRLIAAILMSPLILPHVVLGTALLQYGTMIGLTRSFGALLVGHIVIIMPFVLRAVLPQLNEEQRSLEEASADLGAGPLATFFFVTLPQIRSGVVSGAMFAFISSWINVELSIFNTTAELTTIPVKLFNYVQYSVDPIIAAVSSITILAAAAAIILLDLTLGLEVLSERR